MSVYVETMDLINPLQLLALNLTPYRVGFEHANDGVYGNRYKGQARREYDNGHEDGKKPVTVAEWTPAGVVVQ